MFKKRTGFTMIELLLVIVVVGVVSTVVWLNMGKNKNVTQVSQEDLLLNQEKTSVTNKSSQESQTSQESEDSPPLLIKHLSINLDTYDPKTGLAGDFKFTQQKLLFNRIFMGYGFFVPASSASKEKDNPQPTFILPSGTKVHSLVDGIVVNIPKLYSNDYSIHVAKSKESQFIYETEHVINPLVKVGDTVKAGQIIAEVSDYDTKNHPGFGLVEIGILHGGNPPKHLCPFAYLDPSIKEATFIKLKAFYKAWEEYKGDTTLYNENEPTPGCVTLNQLDG